MTIQCHLQTFSFNQNNANVFVPDEKALQQWHKNEINKNPTAVFPYWGKIWPAAKALCTFLSRYFELIEEKKVVELAAGLGLPSLFSSLYAKEVMCSDYVPEAVEIMKESIKENKLQNMSACALDWNNLPQDLTADVLLLSDINYDPESFKTLYNVLLRFLNNNSTVLLSTPQRLMAKPFIEQLLPFCKQQEEVMITDDEHETMCSVFLLKK